MRFQWFAPIVLVCLAFGQATAPAGQPAQSPAAAPSGQTAPSGQPAQSANAGTTPAATPKPAEVAPTDPVVTLKGLCQDPGKEGSSCQTVMTREQFEKLANALQPNMSPPIKRQLASAYSKMLAMSMAAEKKGLDKTPQFDEMLGFARMQILSQILSRNLQEESQKVSDDEIQKYYDENKKNFEEADFQRIYVPKTKQIAPAAAQPPRKSGAKPAAPKTSAKPAIKPTALTSAAQEEAGGKKPGAAATPKKQLSPEEQQKAGEAAMKKVAENLQKRAAAGEDFEKLQKDAYAAAGIKGNTPPVKMDKTRRNALPQTQSAVFDLKEGEVSSLLTEPSGYYIYKMVAKRTLPLEAVKNEIKNTISSQRFRDAMQAVQQQGTPELNDAYFGATRPPGMPLPPRNGKPQQPPSEPDPD